MGDITNIPHSSDRGPSRCGSLRSMNVTSRSTTSAVRPAGFTLMEILVSISIVMVLAGITLQVMKSGREKAHLVRATQKIKDLGQSFMAYTGENGGLLPRENHSGSGDTWEAAAEPEAKKQKLSNFIVYTTLHDFHILGI